MTTRDEALAYGLSFPDTYQAAPFHDDNWQLVRVKGSDKAFLWIYERNGSINLNLKVDADWREIWRGAYAAVIPAYHQNKEQLRACDGQPDKAHLRGGQEDSKGLRGDLCTGGRDGR